MRAAASLSIAASIALCACTALRADDLLVLRRIAAEGHQRAEEELLACPDFRPGKSVQIHEMIRITLEKGLIVPRSSLVLPGEQSVRKVRIEGLDGWTRLTVRAPRQITQDDPSVHPTGEWYVGLIHSNYQSEQVREDLSLDARAGGIALSKNLQSTRRTLNVMFKQAGGAPEQGINPQVTFCVYDRDDQRQDPVSFTITEPDFSILRRHYSAEVNQYLRPLLREFRIDGLFNVDRVVAAQVFPRQWKRDESMAQKVAALVQQLDADAYSKREAALGALRDLGPDGALYVYHQDQSRLTTEQLARIDVLMSIHRLLSRAQAARLADDPEFLLDCIEGDDPGIRQVAADRFEGLMGRHPDVSADDSTEARANKVGQLRSELLPRRQQLSPSDKPLNSK